MSRLAGLWRNHRGAVLAACAVAAIALAVAVIWPITDLIAAHDVGTIARPSRALHLQTAREAVRTQLLTLGAGLFAAGALVYTGRNFTLSRRNVQLTEQGQVTDRYTKAIEQLGSDKLDVRIGGIYALERVARDSPRDHPTVTEVLAAFIREHSHEQWPPIVTPPLGSIEVGPGAVSSFLDQIEVPARSTRPDVQAALTIIGRREATYDRQPIDLTGANLTRADLEGADLSGAKLTSAILDDARLVRTNFGGANLEGADLSGAKLTSATLDGARLGGANFSGANLAFADLRTANLASSDLRQAILTRVKFGGADLTGALLSPDAVIPEGWRRDTRRGSSGRLRRPDTSSGGAATN